MENRTYCYRETVGFLRLVFQDLLQEARHINRDKIFVPEGGIFFALPFHEKTGQRPVFSL